jgi:hypothetical protein
MDNPCADNAARHDECDAQWNECRCRPVLRPSSRKALRHRIDKRGLAFGIDAVDALARRAQDQLVLALDVAKDTLDPLPAAMPPRM